MAKQPETIFKEKVQEDLKTLEGIWFYKTQEVARRGVPDIIGCYCGLLFALELKVDSSVEPLQVYVLTKIQKAGGFSEVVTPQTWPTVFDKLRKFNDKRSTIVERKNCPKSRGPK